MNSNLLFLRMKHRCRITRIKMSKREQALCKETCDSSNVSGPTEKSRPRFVGKAQYSGRQQVKWGGKIIGTRKERESPLLCWNNSSTAKKEGKKRRSVELEEETNKRRRRRRKNPTCIDPLAANLARTAGLSNYTNQCVSSMILLINPTT